MTYNQLKYFNAVCQFNNISRAAKKMYVSQPSVSLAIKELEDELGEVLFLRNNNKLYLTEAGQMLWEMSEDMLAQMELITDCITKRHMDEEQLTIGMTAEISSWTIPYVERIVQELRGKYPRLEIKLMQVLPIELDKAVGNHLVDVAFCNADGPLPARMSSKIITHAELYVIMGVQHPLAKREKICLSDLRDTEVIGDYIDQEHWQKWLHNFFETEDFIPKTSFFFTQNEAVTWLLRHHPVVAFGRPAINGLQMDGLVARPFDPPRFVDVLAIYDSHFTIRNIVADFIQAAKRVPDTVLEQH